MVRGWAQTVTNCRRILIDCRSPPTFRGLFSLIKGLEKKLINVRDDFKCQQWIRKKTAFPTLIRLAVSPCATRGSRFTVSHIFAWLLTLAAQTQIEPLRQSFKLTTGDNCTVEGNALFFFFQPTLHCSWWSTTWKWASGDIQKTSRIALCLQPSAKTLSTSHTIGRGDNHARLRNGLFWFEDHIWDLDLTVIKIHSTLK